MEGYIIQLLGDGIENLYWSSLQIEYGLIRKAFHEWESSDEYVNEDMEFEEYWNDRNEIKIERIFVDVIFV